MKLYLTSDLHLLHHAWGLSPQDAIDSSRAIAEDLSKRGSGADVLVIAGDFGDKAVDDPDVLYSPGAGAECYDHLFMTAMEVFLANFEHVVYILGNHDYAQPMSEFPGFAGSRVWKRKQPTALEFFPAIWRSVRFKSADGKSADGRVHFLQDSSVGRDEIPCLGSRRIHGCTLFTPGTAGGGVERARMSAPYFYDFRYIPRFTFNTMKKTNAASSAYLVKNIRDGDIVVTHHIPHWSGVSRRFENSDANAFFYARAEKVAAGHKNLLWLYGHTHDGHDFTDGENGNRFLCCPYGYPAGTGEHPGLYSMKKAIEI